MAERLEHAGRERVEPVGSGGWQSVGGKGMHSTDGKGNAKSNMAFQGVCCAFGVATRRIFA